MTVDVESLQRENAALRAQVGSLIGELAKVNERLAELLAIAQRKQRKSASRPEKAHEPPRVVEGDAQQAFDARPKPPELPEKKKAPKGRARPTGRNAIPEHLPVEEHRLRPTSCEHCGATELDVVDEVVEEKLHVVKEHQRRRVVKRTTCRCRRCLERTTPTSCHRRPPRVPTSPTSPGTGPHRSGSAPRSFSD